MDKLQFAKLVSYISALRQVTLDDHEVQELDSLTTIEADEPKVDLTHLFNAMAQGDKIEAVKAHRTLTGFGFMESKNEVEKVMGSPSAIRDAHNNKAEQKLAALQRMVDGNWSDNTLGAEVKRLMKDG